MQIFTALYSIISTLIFPQHEDRSKYDSMIVGFKKNRMYIIGGCLQQLIYIACRRKTYMDGNPK